MKHSTTQTELPTQVDPPALDVSELRILTEEELDEVAGAMGGGLGMGGMNPF
jgi:hypothetical protein